MPVLESETGNGIRQAMKDGVGYVKAGVVKIMQRRREGWAYLRP